MIQFVISCQVIDWLDEDETHVTVLNLYFILRQICWELIWFHFTDWLSIFCLFRGAMKLFKARLLFNIQLVVTWFAEVDALKFIF